MRMSKTFKKKDERDFVSLYRQVSLSYQVR